MGSQSVFFPEVEFFVNVIIILRSVVIVMLSTAVALPFVSLMQL